MKSDNFFKLNNKKYNFIYIDGSHELEDIKNDLINADNHLLENGILGVMIMEKIFRLLYSNR